MKKQTVSKESNNVQKRKDREREISMKRNIQGGESRERR
jgi:hypothetical protein